MNVHLQNKRFNISNRGKKLMTKRKRYVWIKRVFYQRDSYRTVDLIYFIVVEFCLFFKSYRFHLFDTFCGHKRVYFYAPWLPKKKKKKKKKNYKTQTNKFVVNCMFCSWIHISVNAWFIILTYFPTIIINIIVSTNR